MKVDWDLLADHLGGALEGTPDGARVQRLVSTDPGWARAATELSTAMDAVATDLRTLPAPAMPDDIVARLERTLAAAVSPDVAATGAPPAGARSTAPGGRSAEEPRRPPAHPGTRRRRRMARWSAGLAVAAGVAAFAAIGLSSWDADQPFPGLTDSGGEDGAAAPESMDEDRPGALDTLPPLVVATGSNYEATTLEITEPIRPTPRLGGQNAPSPPQQAPEENLGTDDAPDTVPDPLIRLWSDPVERGECLDMISASIQPPPVTINTVDFATYEGEPALIIWATAGDGTRWAWVSGPACGVIAGDPDVWFQTQLS